MTKRFPTLEFWVLVFLLILQRSPFLVQDDTLRMGLTSVGLGIIWFVIAKNLVLLFGRDMNLVLSVKRYLFWPYVAFALLLYFALLRGYAVDSVSKEFLARHLVWWTTVFCFAAALFLVPRSLATLVRLRRGIYWGVGLYVTFNVVLHFFGIESVREITVWGSFGKATILSSLGLDSSRVVFATGTGPGPFGVVSALGFIAGSLIASDKSVKRTSRWLAAGICLISLYALLLSDSRAAVFWLLVTYLIMWLAIGKLDRFVVYLPPATIALPTIILSIAFFVANTQIGDELGRQAGANNVESLSNRNIVWETTLNELRDFEPIHLIGFGVQGQVASGVGTQYSKIFSANYAHNIDKKTAHNYILQYILDMGYVGLLTFFLLTSRAIKTLISAEFEKHGKIHLYCLSFILLAGSTGVAPTIYVNEIFTVLILLIASLVRRPYTTYSSEPRVGVNVGVTRMSAGWSAAAKRSSNSR